MVMMTDGGDCGFRVQYLGDGTGNPADPEHVLDGGTAEMAEIAVGSELSARSWQGARAD